MSNFSAALDYAIVRRWRIFPCGLDKTPLIQRGLHAASNQASNISKWWESRPDALIGLPTGTINGFVVLDVDVKRPEDNGFHTLATMGYATLPDTPLAHTPSGGVHLYFALPRGEIRNTSGKRGRGIGPGLDWRGKGYDDATGLVLVSNVKLKPIADQVSRKDAERALALLTTLLVEFPFANEASRSVGLSMLMTPVLRAAMTVAPLHLATAPTAGTGKSYLADCASVIATGDRCAVEAASPNAEETEKRLVGAALTGYPVGDPHRLPPQKQRPPLPPEAAGDRQNPPRASQRDANPAYRALASASWLWLPARPDGNFTWRAPTIARTISASRFSAISVPDGSRSVMASCMRHRPRHTR
jgi:Bifunctional DNA primase/polymerase, N-terminal